MLNLSLRYPKHCSSRLCDSKLLDLNPRMAMHACRYDESLFESAILEPT